MSNTKEKIGSFIDKYILLIPIMFAIAVIPTIVRITYYNPQLAEYSWFSRDVWVMDMFMYYKNEAMMLLDGVLAVGLVYLLLRRKLSATMAFLPLAVYFILVVFSSIASVAPAQTWNGFYGMFETAYAVFGYCMICYYAYAVLKSEKQIKLVVAALFIGVLVLTGIGASQFLKHDFYLSDFGKDLIYPEEYAMYKDNLQLTFEEGRVYTSLYNPNYVGVYACILVPFLMILAFSVKKVWAMVTCLVLASLVIVCLVGAGSKTAVISLAACLVFMAVYFGKVHWKKMIPVYVVCIGVFVALNMYQGDNAVFSKVVDRVTSGAKKKDISISDITLNDENYTITYKGETILVEHTLSEDGVYNLNVVDADGKQILTSVNEDANGFVLEDERFDGLQFLLSMDADKNIGYNITVNKVKFFVYYSEQYGTYLYTNYYGRPTKLYTSETFDSPVFDLLGGFSGRGYIWSKSIPILKDTLILGSGPDTYSFMFPQYDYVSLIQNGWEKMLITKPHSMYLQTGIQTGVLSLIAYLIFNGWYVIRSMKLYFKKKLDTFTEQCGAAIFVAVISFLIAGLVNDSTVGTSIVYWTLLGIGFACNSIVEKNAAKN